jgi:NAD-dependent DNA ligase
VKDSIRKIIREEVETQNKELITEGALDKLQSALGVAGVVFDPADALNAVISFFRQKWAEGVLNLVSMIPVVGSVVAKPFQALFKIFPAAAVSKVFSKLLKDGNGAATSLVQASANNPKTLNSLVNTVKKNKSTILKFIDGLVDSLNSLPSPVQKVMPTGMLKNLKSLLTNFKSFFNKIGNMTKEQIAAETTKVVAVTKGGEKIDKA